MALIDDITLGRYVSGDSPLHRLDARIKLGGVPLLVIAAFAGQGPSRIAALALLGLALVWLSGIEWRLWWRGLRILRWIFLCTLLLHLFLSPGRTVPGIAWLSLDGLLLGLLVCARMALAVIFSSLLTLTTSPLELAGAVSSFLSPVRRLGVPVREISAQLLLVLHFIPQLREEVRAVVERHRGEGWDVSRGGLVERGRALRRLLAPLILGLADRADRLALAAAAGEGVAEPSFSLGPFRPRTVDLAFLAVGGLYLILVFGVLP